MRGIPDAVHDDPLRPYEELESPIGFEASEHAILVFNAFLKRGKDAIPELIRNLNNLAATRIIVDNGDSFQEIPFAVRVNDCTLRLIEVQYLLYLQNGCTGVTRREPEYKITGIRSARKWSKSEQKKNVERLGRCCFEQNTQA